MKSLISYINENVKNFKLDDNERMALSDLVGILCGNLGDESDIEELQPVLVSLDKNEILQLTNLHDCLDDNETYKSINRNTIIDDIPLINKIYKLMDDNDLLGKQWDLIDAFEKIAGH